MREECLLPLSHCFVCSEQETGGGSSETEPEEQTERQNSRVRRYCALRRAKIATSFYHTYNDTKLTKRSILKDTIRDRQTRSASSSSERLVVFFLCLVFQERMVQVASTGLRRLFVVHP